MASCERCKYQNKQEHEEPCVGCVHNATENFEPMTQADRIRNMSEEELAEFLCKFDACQRCSHNSDNACYTKNCDEIGITEKWLKEKVE